LVSRSNLEKQATPLNVQNTVRRHASRRTFTSTLNSHQKKITKTKLGIFFSANSAVLQPAAPAGRAIA
jgi:hypothetical protein